MPRQYVRPLGCRSYKNYTEETLQKVLDEIRSKSISVRAAAEKYGIHRNTLSSKLKGKAPRKPGGQTVFSEHEERAFISHIIALSSYGFPVTTLELRVIAKTYLDKQGRKVKRFKSNYPGKEWVHSFCSRHRTLLSNRVARNISHGRAQINEDIVNEFFEQYEKECQNVPASNIWNYDETCLVDDPGAIKVLTRRGCKYPEIIKNSSKASTSIMVCGSAAGQTAPVYVVYKSENMWGTWAENGPSEARYNRTKSGWFDARCFEDWFRYTMLPILKRQEGKKILIGDNLSSHLNMQVISDCEANNIAFIALPPNATHLLQPLDVAYFRPMKIAWRKILNAWKINTSNSRCSTIPKDQFPMLLKGMFLELEPTSPENLKSGFRKCGLFPLDRDPVLKRMANNQAEANVPNPELIGASFLENLRATRVTVTASRQYRRRKRVNVPPGRGITAADLMADAQIDGGEGQTQDCLVDGDEDQALSGPVGGYQALDSPVDEGVDRTLDCGLNAEIIPPVHLQSSVQQLEPQPSTSKPRTSTLKSRSITFKSQKLSKAKKKTSSRNRDLEYDSLSDDSSSSVETHISYQESDCSFNWAEIDDIDKEFEIENNFSTTEKKEKEKENTLPDHLDINQLKKGSYVLVKYDNIIYPGQVVRVLEDTALISAMQKSGNFWKWPNKCDIVWYKESSIIQIIKEPIQISKRGLFRIAELMEIE